MVHLSHLVTRYNDCMTRLPLAHAPVRWSNPREAKKRDRRSSIWAKAKMIHAGVEPATSSE